MLIWIAPNENAKRAKILWTLSAGSLQELKEIYLVQGTLTQTSLHGPYDMEGHSKKCVERYCELANKTMKQLYKVATPCIDEHQFREEDLDLLEYCQKYALKLS